MQHNSRERVFVERRLQRACQYVSDQWFPVNETLLGRIQEKLSEGGYSNDCVALTAEVSQDFSLFAYCLRELGRMLREQGVETPEIETAMDLFQRAGLARIQEILATPANEISRHQIHHGTSLQSARIQEALLSATTAELLCARSGIRPEVGFDAALLRQLGMTLVAWNYPEVYQRAVSMLSEVRSLDLAIAQILGYSPSLLALRLVRSWSLPPTMIHGLYDGDDEDAIHDEIDTVDAVGSVLASICRVGEALARANHPEIYPSARQEWEGVRHNLKNTLGDDALETIQEHYEEHCLAYLEIAPDIFRGAMLVDPAMHIAEISQANLVARNPFLEKCRPHLREKLLKLYESISVGATAPLATLVREVIPSAGFTGGYIFTIDPALDRLIAQTVIARPILRDGESVDPHESEDFVAQAFQSPTVIVKAEEINHDSMTATYVAIAWAVGFSQRVGVLALEMPEVAFNQGSADHMNHFSAILQALNDVLGLR